MKTALATEKIAHDIRNTLQVLTMSLRDVNGISTGNDFLEQGISAAETYAQNLSRMLDEVVRRERERVQSSAGF